VGAVSGRPFHVGLFAMALATLFGAAAAGAGTMATFGQRYGANPTRSNGGRSKHGAAQDKRAARRRANLRKHPRGAR
jgi:hypothetical protein